MESVVVTPFVGIGDTLMITPALQLLKQYRPDCSVTVFTFNRANNEILQHNPHIDTLWYYPAKITRFFPSLYHIFRNFTFKYKTCVNFYPTNRISYTVFSLLTGAQRRLGHRYLHKDFSQLNWLKNLTVSEDPQAHCVVENVRLLKFFNIDIALDGNDTAIPATKIFLTKKEEEFGKQYWSNFGEKTALGIHTGTSTFKNHAHRRWPKEYFIEMINQLPDVHFFLFGSSDEIEINTFIKDSANIKDRVTVVTDKTIREVASIIKYLDGFISNDSGLMHIAAAVGVPVVAILGPTNPRYIHPWKVPHTIVRLDLSCSPCFYYSPRPLKCIRRNSYQCLTELPAQRVIEAVRRQFNIS